MKKYVGLSVFPLLKRGYPVNRIIKCYKGVKNPAIAVLANRFGNAWANLNKVTSTIPGIAVEVHFMSGPARRGGRQEKFDPWFGMSVKELNERLEIGTLYNLDKKLLEFKTKLEQSVPERSPLFICPELEDNLTDEAYKKLLKAFKAAFADWVVKPKWVRCPCTGGSFIPRGVLKETHGVPGNIGNVYNPDGVSVAFHDGEDYFQTVSMDTLKKAFARQTGAQLRFVWVANMQGVGDSDSFNYASIFDRDYKVTDQAIMYSNMFLKDV